jgi:hypothetical protein
MLEFEEGLLRSHIGSGLGATARCLDRNSESVSLSPMRPPIPAIGLMRKPMRGIGGT